MKNFTRIIVLSTFVFFFTWLILYKTQINTLPIQSEDTLPTAFLPLTILKERTLYLDSYYEMIIKKYPHPDDRSFQTGLTPFYLRKAGASFVSAFPIMTALLALPIYFPAVILYLEITWEIIYLLSHLSASFIVALSGGYLYLLLRKHFSLNEKISMKLTFIYLFCTINFALISQSLWQHGTVQLFLILFLYFMYEQKFFWAAFMFGFGVLSRPTILGVAPYLGYLVIFHLKTFKNILQALLNSALGLVIPLLFFLWYNKTFYLDIANQGYSNQIFSNWFGKFPEGFLGLWISPSKGILVYSPVFIFSLIGLYLSLKNNKWRKKPDYIFYFMAIISHTLILGRWKHWFGGYSFGYRMASDIIPLLVLLLVPFIQSKLYKKLKSIFDITIIFSLLVQIFGMIFFDGIWHNAYDLGYKDTSWLWSIKDSEFAFNIRRILVKIGIIERACPKCLPK